MHDTYKTELLITSKTADGLIAPPTYIVARPEIKEAICNGCGTPGWKGAIVPDSIWGLDITDCCYIHDWMYHYGMTEADKYRADLMFLLNMLYKIDNASKWLRPLRRYRAISYYSAVSDLGHLAFKKGKEGIH